MPSRYFIGRISILAQIKFLQIVLVVESGKVYIAFYALYSASLAILPNRVRTLSSNRGRAVAISADIQMISVELGGEDVIVMRHGAIYNRFLAIVFLEQRYEFFQSLACSLDAVAVACLEIDHRHKVLFFLGGVFYEILELSFGR